MKNFQVNLELGEMVDIKVRIREWPRKVDYWQVNIPCPKCKAQNRVSLGQVEREETIRCVGCGVNIKLLDKERSVEKSTRELQRSLDKLKRTLRKLG